MQEEEKGHLVLRVYSRQVRARQAQRRRSGLTARRTMEDRCLVHVRPAATIAFRDFRAHVIVSSALFFLGAALLRAFLCILRQPHCVHSARVCEFHRGTWRTGRCASWVSYPHVHLFLNKLETSMPPVSEISRCCHESTTVS